MSEKNFHSNYQIEFEMKTSTPDLLNSYYSTVNIYGKQVVFHKKEARIPPLHHDAKILTTIEMTEKDDETKPADYIQSRSIYSNSKKGERRIQKQILNGN